MLEASILFSISSFNSEKKSIPVKFSISSTETTNSYNGLLEFSCGNKKAKDKKYYAKKYYFVRYSDKLDENNEFENTVFESKSIILNNKAIGDIEEIPYHGRGGKNEVRLDRVSYDKEFWDTFYKNNPID